MVLLNEPGAREYLTGTDVLPCLEAGLEEMLKASTSKEKIDPIAFLARWLMRNNPRHNPEAAERVEKLRAAEAQRAADAAVEQQRADRDAGDLAARAELARKAGGPVPGLAEPVTIAMPGGGTMSLKIEGIVG